MKTSNITVTECRTSCTVSQSSSKSGRCHPRKGNPARRGYARHPGMTETAAATPEGTAAAVFLRQSQPAPHTCRVPVRQTCLSSSPDLRLLSSPTAFSDCSNDRLSPCVAVSALTVAVPFVNLTRFPILRRGCYHLRRHLNCHSLFVSSIARARGFVNPKKGIALWKKIWYDEYNSIK